MFLGLAKPPLKLRHGWVITSRETYECNYLSIPYVSLQHIYSPDRARPPIGYLVSWIFLVTAQTQVSSYESYEDGDSGLLSIQYIQCCIYIYIYIHIQNHALQACFNTDDMNDIKDTINNMKEW